MRAVCVLINSSPFFGGDQFLTNDVPGDFFNLMNGRLLSVLVFFACVPQAGSLLLKMYGVCGLQEGFLYTSLPALLCIVIIYNRVRRSSDEMLTDSIHLGVFGGLLATFAYDLCRIPFVIFGQRIFAPIAAYGVWLLGAESSSRFTDLAGWSYHFLNGISFGIMYALFMRRRSFFWAILWACLLETIAFLSPFGRIFGFTANPSTLGIAYFGHVVYGIPLGLVVMKDAACISWLKTVPRGIYVFGYVAILAIMLGQILNPQLAASDKATLPQRFVINGDQITPDWQRVPRDSELVVFNESADAKTIVIKKLAKEIAAAPGESVVIPIPEPGIYQIFVQTSGRTRSSFLMVEPVETQGARLPGKKK